MHLDLDDVAVLDVLYDVTGMLHSQAARKGLRFVVDSCAPSLAVRADRERLRQILVNLSVNAVRFTDAGGTVQVSFDASAEQVRIVVRDTGAGITAGELARVFDPMEAIHHPITRPAKDTGLRLSGSRDFARAMGGDLTAASTPGAGSAFTLMLPRTADLADLADPAPDSPGPAEAEEPPQHHVPRASRTGRDVEHAG